MLRTESLLSFCILLSVARLLADDDTDKVEKAANRVEVKIVNVDTGKVLAPLNDLTSEGMRMALAEDNGTPIRLWQLEKDGESYKLINSDTEMVLDVYMGEKDEDTPIIQWPAKKGDNNGNNSSPGGLDNQRWLLGKFDLDNPKPFRIKSKLSNMVVDVGSQGWLVQRTADDTANSQLWKIVYAHPPKFVKLVNVGTGWVLGLESDSANSGSRAVLAKDVDSKDKNYQDRQWKLMTDGDNFKLLHRPSGLALQLADDSRAEDHSIVASKNKTDTSGTDGQCWSWDVGTTTNNKPARLKSKLSGLVLDVDDDGNIVQRRASDNAKSQLWLLMNIDE